MWKHLGIFLFLSKTFDDRPSAAARLRDATGLLREEPASYPLIDQLSGDSTGFLHTATATAAASSPPVTVRARFSLKLSPFLQKFSTSGNSEKLSWERSTKDILLGKLKFALRSHQVHEAWESFQDFRSLYGYPEVHLLNQLIVQLSYSSNHVWMRKACDLVLQIVREKSGLLHDDTLTKLALSLARLQMPSPASVILRLMLDKGCVPSMHLLSLVVFHIVKSEIGTHLSSNYLFQVCDLYNCLNDKKVHHAVTVKLDTLVFNLVLDACVKFKLSLKGLRLIELMSLTGTVADAHSIVIISQILEMNGLRDEMQELKDHIDRVSAAYVCHYCQFYDSLLRLHFKFNDIDAAAKLVLDMTSSHNCNVKKEYGKHLQNPCFISIGSPNLRSALKIHIEPEQMCKDFVLKVESRQVLIFYRGGKLVLSNRALAKFISGYKKDGRIGELSKLLLTIQGELCSVAGSSLCFDVISSCIQLGWLECAHDILDDIEVTGSPMGQDMYLLLVSAYQKRGLQREAKALLKQMKKVGLLNTGLSDDATGKHNLCEKTLNSPGKADLAIALAQILEDEDQTIFPLVYNFNSSIFFFCKARMIEDALKAYRRMLSMNVQPTSQTFSFLMRGYSSLGMYREITILWRDIKRFMKSDNLVGNRDLYELLLLNFLRGGYFERVMEVISHMRDHNMYADKWIYKIEFLRLHKNLYRSLKASNTRTEAQSKRLEHVQEFRKWVGID
ncbi:Pentatricopeptide repeat-containing protein [Vigna angularis]|uniref:Pentatricopeptide repeat-containing protein n=1 Tax=Phaseolus angularis TaxID=3914 RepID=A0A8T0KFG9_PHAAN|nr:Pentatricopeptide repeat-containing protein [Vigna angularis]